MTEDSDGVQWWSAVIECSDGVQWWSTVMEYSGEDSGEYSDEYSNEVQWRVQWWSTVMEYRGGTKMSTVMSTVMSTGTVLLPIRSLLVLELIVRDHFLDTHKTENI
jgi:hypothetical protein